MVDNNAPDKSACLQKYFSFSIVPATDAGPNRIAATWTVPEDLPYLAGHFPGRPVLPAVAVLDATTQLIRIVTGDPSRELAAVLSAKFTAVIAPGHLIGVRLEPLAGNEWLAHWYHQTSGERLAELRLLL